MAANSTRLLIALMALTALGCMLRNSGPKFDPDVAHYRSLASGTDYPDSRTLAVEIPEDAFEPRTIRNATDEPQYVPLKLEDAIRTAVANSPVLRDLGGAVVHSPGTARTIQGPALESTDPQHGMEAALSAFDASLATRLFFEKNNRMVNNYFAGDATQRTYRQDLAMFQTQLSKSTVVGTQVFLRSNVAYDSNNAIGNFFPRTWDSILETEIRQPVLQGAGVQFNRIAGPNSAPGNYNGVMIARINTDVGIADFRMAIRDVVSNVENAYWDLYFAYRDLDAKVEARNRSLEYWRAVRAMVEIKQEGGVAEREAQFREQYYRFEEEVQNALTGLLDSGRGGVRGGVHAAERRLRLLLGMAINDGQLIRPSDEPAPAKIEYQWHDVVAESLTRREELYRQRLQVRRRELELTASRNFLRPRLDLVSRYRIRGLGENFMGGAPIGPADPPDFANSSLDNLFGTHYQEWQLGGELTFPIGYRRAHAAVRNAQLQLARERTILEEQQRQILHDLSNAVADAYRAFEVCQTNFNRRLAAKKQVDILRGKLKDRLPVSLDQLIDAERRFADADSQYHRSLSEYMLALKNVQLEKGTLLDYWQVVVPDGPDGQECCPTVAYRSLPATCPRPLNYVLERTSFGFSDCPAEDHAAPLEGSPIPAPPRGGPPADADPPPEPATNASAFRRPDPSTHFPSPLPDPAADNASPRRE